jgi:hypothetical protein
MIKPPIQQFSTREKSDIPPLDLHDVNPNVKAGQVGNNWQGVVENEATGDDSGRSLNAWVNDQDQFKGLPPLPDGWIRVRSRTTGAIYFCYTDTGETTFTEPTGPPSGLENEARELPPGWVEVMSRNTGQIYYFHAGLEKSQFEFPTLEDSELPPEAADENGLPSGWVEVVSNSTGKVYYYHADTETSQFEFPT